MSKLFAAVALISAGTLGNVQAAMDIPVTPEGDASYWWARGGGAWWEPSQTSIGAHYYGFPGYVQYSTGFMQYSLSGLSGPITGATLHLNMVDISGPDATVHLYHATTATQANGTASQGIGGDVVLHTFHTSDPTGWLVIDVTDEINSDLALGNPFACFNTNYGGVYDSGPTNYQIASGESATPSFLRVAAVPEPASLGLLGLGAMALIHRRR